MWSNILVTGGTGRLGKELQKSLRGQYPSRKALDVTNIQGKFPCDLVVHMAAFTKVEKSEMEKFKCFDINVLGTYNMLKHFEDKPFVYISTEHVFARGIHWQSKLISELLVKSLAKNYLIIRTLFKPTPWPFDYAFTDQMTRGDYVNVIAMLVAEEIKGWDGRSQTIYVGTRRKSMYEMAKRTKPDVKPNSVNDLGLKRPKDYITNVKDSVLYEYR